MALSLNVYFHCSVLTLRNLSVYTMIYTEGLAWIVQKYL